MFANPGLGHIHKRYLWKTVVIVQNYESSFQKDCLQCVYSQLQQKKKKTVRESRQQLMTNGTKRHHRFHQGAKGTMIMLICAPFEPVLPQNELKWLVDMLLSCSREKKLYH